VKFGMLYGLDGCLGSEPVPFYTDIIFCLEL